MVKERVCDKCGFGLTILDGVLCFSIVGIKITTTTKNNNIIVVVFDDTQS